MKKRLIFLFAILFLIGLISSENLEKEAKIIQLEIQEKSLNLTYSFDKKNIIGEFVTIEIWINNEAEGEVLRIIDNLKINKDKPIKKNLIIKLPKNLVGFHSVNIAPSYNKENFDRQIILLGNPKTTGFSILKSSNKKLMSYVVFLIFIGIGIFFIVRRHFKKPIPIELKSGLKKIN